MKNIKLKSTIISLTSLCCPTLLVASIPGANAEVNHSLSFEQQPLYLESKKAMECQDYEKARRMLLELGKIESYKAQSLRMQGILETQKTKSDINYAVDLFKKAYELDDSESFALYLNALAKAGRFDELTDYHASIFSNATHDRHMLETYCIIAEHLNRNEEKQAFLMLARRVPVEIAKDNLDFLRLLIKYGEQEDKLVIDFLNREFYYSIRSKVGEDILRAPLPVRIIFPPDRATIENYQKTDEYKHYLKFINERNLDAKNAISQLSILAKTPQYQTLVNSDLAYIALKESDLLRVEQLSEISLTLGDIRMVNPLFISLIVQNKLDKAKKYESQFFSYAFSAGVDANASLFAKYCLLSDNKDMFLKWVRSTKWDAMLEDLGRKKLFLEGLEKWGQSIDSILINYLKTHPPKSDNEMDFDFVWGIPYDGTLFPMGNNRIQWARQRK